MNIFGFGQFFEFNMNIFGFVLVDFPDLLPLASGKIDLRENDYRQKLDIREIRFVPPFGVDVLISLPDLPV